MVTLEAIITVEEIVLEEVIEILKLMEIEINLQITLRIMILFKEKPQEEIIIMLAKLIEKYNNLAREALSNGDKILSENYFQHADHFTRILGERETQKKL